MNNQSQKLILTLLLQMIFGIASYADTPTFDIAEIQIRKQTYYLKYETPGLIIETDCYHTFGKDYIEEGRTIVADYLLNNTIEVFEELHIINLEKMDLYSWEGNRELYALQKRIELEKINYSGKFELISITKGNTFGYIYSGDLDENDNIWLEDYPIEKYFDLSNYEICEMSLYGIEGNYTVQKKEILRKRLDEILKKYKAEEFKKVLKELYKENIIMIGFCSC